MCDHLLRKFTLHVARAHWVTPSKANHRLPGTRLQFRRDDDPFRGLQPARPRKVAPMTGVTVGGEVRNLDIDLLDLDRANPRFLRPLPESASLADIAVHMDEHFDPLRVAESISRHGFFVSEPLIATPNGDRYTVVEGNRRLTALLGLAHEDVRARLEQRTKGWAGLRVLEGPVVVPVVVVASRSEVDALLGFRHISGIEPWDPYAQAKFIADLLAREPDFAVVARRVGRTESAVRGMYRDFDLLEQAETDFGFDVSRARESFGVFNAALGVVNIRAFINAPAPRHVSLEFWPVPEEKKSECGRLLIYLFGKDEFATGKVIKESRELQKLGRALSSPIAEAALRNGSTLDEALEAPVSRAEQAQLEVVRARNALERALAHVHADRIAIRRLNAPLETVRTALDRLQAEVGGSS